MTEQRLEEVALEKAIVSFDGRVLEFFGQGNASRRIHVATIEKIERSDGRFTGSILQLKVRGESDTYFDIEADEVQRDALEVLLAKVEAARSAGGGQ
jgi:hypothetical protein